MTRAKGQDNIYFYRYQVLNLDTNRTKYYHSQIHIMRDLNLSESMVYILVKNPEKTPMRNKYQIIKLSKEAYLPAWTEKIISQEGSEEEGHIVLTIERTKLNYDDEDENEGE